MEDRQRRRLGRVERETPLWWKRYRRLISEGFIHNEAVTIAEGIIGSPTMRRGRRRRKQWHDMALEEMGLTPSQVEDEVFRMYDEADWGNEYDQFYAEEGGVLEAEVA